MSSHVLTGDRSTLWTTRRHAMKSLSRRWIPTVRSGTFSCYLDNHKVHDIAQVRWIVCVCRRLRQQHACKRAVPPDRRADLKARRCIYLPCAVKYAWLSHDIRNSIWHRYIRPWHQTKPQALRKAPLHHLNRAMQDAGSQLTSAPCLVAT